MKLVGQAPARISLFGGGTDLPIFYEKYGGIVISMAINIRQHLEIEDGPQSWSMPERANKSFYTNLFKECGVDELSFKDKSFKTSFDGEIEGGLGTSAAAAVLMVHAAHKITGREITSRDIAEKAWDVEVNKMGLYGGKQDQYASVTGGMNAIVFDKNGINTYLIQRDIAEKISRNVLLFYLGYPRKDPKVQEMLLDISEDRTKNLLAIRHYAEMAYGAIWLNDLYLLGELLDRSWAEKKKVNSGVTYPEIDLIYEGAKEAGALGGKVCGSGGGGYIIFVVPQDKQTDVTNVLNNAGLKRVDYAIDWQGAEVRQIW